MWMNKLKQKLAAGETVYGPILRLPGPVSVELAAAVGFDFVFIDMEHSPLDLAAVEVMILAAAARGVTPLVRIPEVSRVGIHRVLEIGAHGVIVPQVGTEAEARVVSEASRFAPVGARGMSGPVRGDGWGALPLAESLLRMSQEVLTLAQIESEAALANLDLIAQQSGIDVLFVGPNDLSQALGLPGQVAHPRVVAAIEGVIAAANRHGKQAGIYVGSPDDASFWRERGVRVIATGLDIALLKQSYATLKKGLGN